MEEATEEWTGLPGEWTDKCPPRCPRRGCGRFMATFRDGHGMPVATCGCGGSLGARDLIDGGYFEEI